VRAISRAGGAPVGRRRRRCARQSRYRLHVVTFPHYQRHRPFESVLAGPTNINFAQVIWRFPNRLDDPHRGDRVGHGRRDRSIPEDSLDESDDFTGITWQPHGIPLPTRKSELGMPAPCKRRRGHLRSAVDPAPGRLRTDDPREPRHATTGRRLVRPEHFLRELTWGSAPTARLWPQGPRSRPNSSPVAVSARSRPGGAEQRLSRGDTAVLDLRCGSSEVGAPVALARSLGHRR
jgi:hypothetical protein